MTITWDDIFVASSGRSYIRMLPTKRQARCGWSVVASFISNVARGEAWIAFKEQAETFGKAARKSVAAVETYWRKARHERILMEVEDDCVLDSELVTRERVAHLAEAFHGPRPLLAGETP